VADESLQLSIRSLRKKWWISFGALAIALLTDLAAHDDLPTLGGIVVWFGLIVGVVYSVLCFKQQGRVINELRDTQVRPAYWRGLSRASWVFGPPGLLIETGIYLLYVRRYLRQRIVTAS
jgi:hypothetical protein